MVDWILETHAHADHLRRRPYLRKHLGGKIAIGGKITQVQNVFRASSIWSLNSLPTAASSTTCLKTATPLRLAPAAQALSVPGHPACAACQVGDAVFVGDTLFMPDVGTARCDFGGNAHAVPVGSQVAEPATRDTSVHVPDHPPEGREAQWECTVADQRARNIHVHDGVSEAEFVAMRT